MAPTSIPCRLDCQEVFFARPPEPRQPRRPRQPQWYISAEQRSQIMAGIAIRSQWINIQPVRGIANEPIEHRTPGTAYGVTHADAY